MGATHLKPASLSLFYLFAANGTAAQDAHSQTINPAAVTRRAEHNNTAVAELCLPSAVTSRQQQLVSDVTMFNFHIVHTLTARFIIIIIRRLCFGGALPSRPTRRAFVSQTFHVSTRRKRVVRNSWTLALASHAKNKQTRIAVITAGLLFYILVWRNFVIICFHREYVCQPRTPR